ncbi:MAG: type II toxin-antitoxin system VapC family toxin [Nitrosotalea sp.]
MIILDTSFIISYFNTRDQNHSKAAKMMKQMHEPFCLTDYIFGETATVSLIRLKSIEKAAKIGEILKSLLIIDVEKSSFDKAWNLFCKQKDTALSFTDCTTISIMQENYIEKIATFDEDFGKIRGIRVVGS